MIAPPPPCYPLQGTSILARDGEMIIVPSCWGKQDKLPLDGLLGLSADFMLPPGLYRVEGGKFPTTSEVNLTVPYYVK